MAAVTGNTGVLQVSPDNSTYSAVASLTSWSLEESADAVETTAMGANNYKTFKTSPTPPVLTEPIETRNRTMNMYLMTPSQGEGDSVRVKYKIKT